MKIRIIAICAASVAMLCSSIAAAPFARSDRGVIEALYEHEIQVQGEEGLHILEPMQDCSWCVEGMDVVLTFLKYGRATLSPEAPSRDAKPVKVWVLRDGRDGL